MRYGLISDIHANLEALDAVLAELSSVDAFICLGDIVGYGPDPGPCISRIRDLPHLTCIAGNHDLAAVGRYDLDLFNEYARRAIVWTSKQLSPDDRSYLGSLPRTLELDGATLVHGALPDHMGYILTVEDAAGTFREMPGPLCFVGHTHVAEYYRNRNGTSFYDQLSLYAGGSLTLEPDLRYIINPGSIGQPRDSNPFASFGIYDAGARAVETRRVPYDIAGVQEKMRQADLPAYLANRLADGR